VSRIACYSREIRYFIRTSKRELGPRSMFSAYLEENAAKGTNREQRTPGKLLLRIAPTGPSREVDVLNFDHVVFRHNRFLSPFFPLSSRRFQFVRLCLIEATRMLGSQPPSRHHFSPFTPPPSTQADGLSRLYGKPRVAYPAHSPHDHSSFITHHSSFI